MVCFSVLKSSGRLRFILDVRRWNAQFLAPPPGVRLLSSEGFGRIEVALPENVKVKSEMGRNQLDEFAIAISTTDVRDCFEVPAHVLSMTVEMLAVSGAEL